MVESKLSGRRPNNGMVDTWGKLTPLAHATIAEFRKAYPNSLGVVITKFPPVGRSVARLIKSGRLTQAEYESAVDERLTTAVASYDPDKGGVSTHLVWAACGAAENLVRRWEIEHRGVSVFLDAPPERDDGEPFANCLVRENSESDLVEAAAVAARILEATDWRTRKILQLRFEEDLTLRQIGKRMGISTERVRQLMNRGIDAIQWRMRAGPYVVHE